MSSTKSNDPIPLSFASELPYERWWGIEILECTPEAVDLSRMNDGAALLVGHRDMVHVGTVIAGSAKVRADRKLACEVRFASDDEAQRYRQRVDDQVLQKVSVGYVIHEATEENVNESGARTSRPISDARALSVMQRAIAADEPGDLEGFYRDLDEAAGGTLERAQKVSTFRITRWEPFEVSLVSIPADPSVGVGRSSELPRAKRVFSTHAGQAGQQTQEKQMDDVKEKPAAPAPVDVRVIENQARDAERQRAADIRALGAKLNFGDMAERSVNDGSTLEQFREKIVEQLVARGTMRPAESSEIGMSQKELSRFSLCRLMLAAMYPLEESLQRDAAFELEASRAAMQLRGKRTSYRADERAQGVTVPVDILRAPAHKFGNEFARAYAQAVPEAIGKRDLNVGTATAGGNLVATDLLSGSFIDLLRARSRVMSLGATVLDGLEGNIAIPRQTGGASVFWVTEGGDVSESQFAVDQVALSPKTIGLFTDYTRRLLQQSSIAIEALVRADQALGIGTGMDVAAINGSGTGGQPTGILNISGIGSVAGGTNGAAPTWDHLVDLESSLGNANADVGRLAYLTNSRVRGRLRKTQKFSGTNGVEIWEDGRESGMGMVAGYDAAVSNNVPNNLTKGTSTGVCSAIIFANWSEAIFGMWGGLDYILDTSVLALSGGRRLVALQDCDFQARRPASFSAMKDALTA